MTVRRLAKLALSVMLGLIALLLLTLSRESGIAYFNKIPTGDMSQALNGMYRYLELPDIPFPLFEIWVPELASTYNLAFTDSAPIFSLFLKLAQVLGVELNPFLTWTALIFALQAACFYELLRILGIRSATVRCAGVLMALCAPAFLERLYTDHLVLSGHFAAIVPLLLFFGLTSKSTAIFIMLWAAWLSTALLIHPYFAAMTAVIYIGSAIDRTRKTGISLSISLLLTAPFLTAGLILCLGGYFHYESITPASGGFGMFSMNLLSPFWPAKSGVFETVTSFNPTGGQGEGYNYLGLGTIVALCLAAFHSFHRGSASPDGADPILTPGLIFWVTSLFMYSLSSKIYIGNTLFLNLSAIYSPVVEITSKFRSSGRMFWPISYLLLAIALRVLDRTKTGSRLHPHITVLALLLLQVADSSALWRANANKPLSGFNRESWGRLFSAHNRLMLWPRSGCTASAFAHYVNSELALVANRYEMTTNSMPSARHFQTCEWNPAVLDKNFVLEPGVLHIFHDSSVNYFDIATHVGLDHCRKFMSMTVCTDQIELVEGSANFELPSFDATLEVGLEYDFRTGSPASRFLLSGWHEPVSAGVWSKTGTARVLLPRFSTEAEPLLLEFDVQAFLNPKSPRLAVPVRVNGELHALWHFSNRYNRGIRPLRIDREDFNEEAPTIEFSLPDTPTPAETGVVDDHRSLGIFLAGVTALPVFEREGKQLQRGPSGEINLSQSGTGSQYLEDDAWEMTGAGEFTSLRSGAGMRLPSSYLQVDDQPIYFLVSSNIDDFDDRVRVQVEAGEQRLATWEFSARFNTGWRLIEIDTIPEKVVIRFDIVPERADHSVENTIRIHRITTASGRGLADDNAYFEAENIIALESSWRSETLTAGWHPALNPQVWNDGSPAGVSLRCGPFRAEKVSAEFDVEAFLPPGETRIISVSVDGQAIQHWQFNSVSNRGLRLLELDCTTAQDNRLLLKFEIDNAKSPIETGLNSDTRILGFALHGIHVKDHEG